VASLHKVTGSPLTTVNGCEELGATIDELLDLTRIEAGQLRLWTARMILF
jgi:hypothetical protein